MSLKRVADRIIPDLELLNRHSGVLGHPPEQEGRLGVRGVSLIRVGLDHHPGVHLGCMIRLVLVGVVRIDLR